MPQHLAAGNPRLKAVRALHDRAERRLQRRFIVEGVTNVADAIACGAPLVEVFTTQSAFERHAFLHTLEPNVRVTIVEERSIDRMADTRTPQGVIAVAEMRESSLEKLLELPGMVLLLADIGDPGNAGTLVRSADAFGCRGVIFGERGVDPYHPKVVRGAMGSLFRCSLTVASAEALRRHIGGWTVVGLDVRGEPLEDLTWQAATILAVGHERHGLGAFAALCSKTAAIRMAAGAESLNAAVAGSIAMYEARKQAG